MKSNLVKARKYKVNLLIYCCFLCLSLIYIVLFVKSNQLFVGDDRMFHLERLEEIYLNIKQGHLYSYIATNSFSQIGQAINAFYPPLVACVYAILRLIIKSPILTFYALIALEQFAGLSIAYYSGKKILDQTKSAFVFAIVLRFSTYVAYNDFTRFDIGEGWALVFMPLTFCGLYLITVKNDYRCGITALILGLTFQTYSHILLPVLTCGVLLLFYMLSFPVQNNKVNSIKAIMFSAVIYLLNCLYIIIPILVMSRIKINAPEHNKLGNYSLAFSDFVNNSLSNTINFASPNIGFILILILLIGTPFMLKMGYISKSYLLLGFAFSILSTNLFPWKLLSNTPIEIVQFPWRFLNFSLLFLSLYLAKVMGSFFNRRKYVLLITCLSVMLTLGSQSQFRAMQYSKFRLATTTMEFEYPYQMFINNNNYDKILSKNRKAVYTARSRDYVPQSALKQLNSIFDHTILINGKHKGNARVTGDFQEETFKFNKSVPKGSIVKLPFLIYNAKNYQLRVNGVKRDFETSPDSCLQFKTDKKYRNIKARVKFITPLSFIVARSISGISLFCFIISSLFLKFRRKSQQV